METIRKRSFPTLCCVILVLADLLLPLSLLRNFDFAVRTLCLSHTSLIVLTVGFPYMCVKSVSLENRKRDVGNHATTGPDEEPPLSLCWDVAERVCFTAF